ncbi:MAG: DUF192 domain-containing protein [Candidatus Omnitrophota bacterium]|jgi:uncharacterized membrane protein (UPF0127 family)
MKIINITKNAILADNTILAQTVLARLKGLLFRKEFRNGEALIIKPCNSIHTFFMRFPIDVIFIDSNNKIVKIRKGIKPFRATPVYFKSKFVIELPSGTAAAANTEESDQLSIE